MSAPPIRTNVLADLLVALVQRFDDLGLALQDFLFAPTSNPDIEGEGRWGNSAGPASTVSRLAPWKSGSLGRYASLPVLTQVTVSHAPPVVEANTTWEQSIHVTWATGQAKHNAVIDLPTGGVVFTIAGADGSTVEVRGSGDSAAEVPAILVSTSLCGGTPRPAQRTQLLTAPAELGMVFPIPKWARSARLVTDVAAGFAAAGQAVQLFSDAAGGNIVAESPWDFDRIYPIPFEARFWTLVDPGAGARALRMIWELQL